MSEIKIFVSHTPNSSQICVSDPLLYHVTAGSSFQTKPLPAYMLRDNTGDHISHKNRSYCELTTQYWAWKNIEADYYGFCHYRRYFSFAPGMLPEDSWGCLSYPYMDGGTKKKLCLEEAAIRQKVEQHDVLIAKGIPIKELYADSVYDHYKNASELKIEDLELFQNIICEKYPMLRKVSESYINGKIFYPCNMFVMKRDIFRQYSEMLFDILDEFDHRADMSLYSREGLRTPGHLGERFAGIYYEYLKQQGVCRLGELQMALIEHTRADYGTELYSSETGAYKAGRHNRETAGVYKAGPYSSEAAGVYKAGLYSSETADEYRLERPDQEIPVVLAADQAYVPVLFTCIRSIVDHASEGRNYHIYIFHTDIHEEDMQVFDRELSCRNIKIDFVDVGARVAGYRLKAKEHITTETYYRFLILDILKGCTKAVYLDSDVIVCRDVAQLYDVPLGDCLLAAAADPDFAGQCNGANMDTRHYCEKVLKLKDPFSYAQAGVLVFHIEKLRQKTDVEELFRMADEGDYKYSDQDILNIVCEGHIKKIAMAWNMLINNRGRRYDIIRSAPAGILDEYEQARKEPYIIHYAGDAKPWDDPEMDFAQVFWKTARGTPYYEQLLRRAVTTTKEKSTLKDRIIDLVRRAAKKILPHRSRIRLAVGKLYWRLK